MPSRTVSKKFKSCMFVTSAYKVHRDPLLTGIVELSRRDPQPVEPPADQDGTPQEVPEVAQPFFFQPGTTSIEEAKEKVGWYLDSVVGAMEHRAMRSLRCRGRRRRRTRLTVDLISCPTLG